MTPQTETDAPQRHTARRGDGAASSEAAAFPTRPAFRSTLIMKAVMALTGVILLAYVIGHAAGNLKVYAGPETYNHYAEWLRTVGAPAVGRGQLLWTARVILLAAVGLHIWSAIVLARRSWSARETDYARSKYIGFSYASRTMRWGGLIIALFVLYHLMHFTWGNLHPDFIPGDVYHNFIVGFSSWPVSLVYIAAMIVLGFHIYHGIWSGMQTLGLNQPRYNRYRRPLALVIAWVIVLVNISFPVAVLTGFLP